MSHQGSAFSLFLTSLLPFAALDKGVQSNASHNGGRNCGYIDAGVFGTLRLVP